MSRRAFMKMRATHVRHWANGALACLRRIVG
jgi:hypothetical protein